MGETRQLPKRKCELCSKDAECRPYGPRGEWICFDCGMKDENTTKRQASKVLFDENIN